METQHSSTATAANETYSDHAGTWAKVEIMGHETIYGRVQASPLLPSGVRVCVLPPGDPSSEDGDDGQKDTYPRDFSEQAIFSVTPIGEAEARRLARKDYYEPSPLDHAEKEQLIAGDVRAAKRAIRSEGYEVIDEGRLERIGSALAEKVIFLHDLEEALDLDGELLADLQTEADNGRRALHQTLDMRARRLLEQAAQDDNDSDSDEGDDEHGETFGPDDELPL